MSPFSYQIVLPCSFQNVCIAIAFSVLIKNIIFFFKALRQEKTFQVLSDTLKNSFSFKHSVSSNLDSSRVYSFNTELCCLPKSIRIVYVVKYFLLINPKYYSHRISLLLHNDFSSLRKLQFLRIHQQDFLIKSGKQCIVSNVKIFNQKFDGQKSNFDRIILFWSQYLTF